jgi:predicted RNA-binding Zn-ribbon protein involved in translation (DUF1610 family)
VGDFLDQEHSAAMADDRTCPECGTPVPTLQGRWAYGSGAGQEIALHPWRQRADCPSCGAALIREADPPSPWRVDDRADPG